MAKSKAQERREAAEQAREDAANLLKRRAFLDGLKSGLSVSAAIRNAGASTRVYEWAKLDAEFSAAWDEALDEGTDRLEDIALRRATVGYTKTRTHFYQGAQVGQDIETVYSDTLIIFLLKARRPDKYRERYDVTNSDNSLRAFVEGMKRIEADEAHATTPAQIEPTAPRQH